MESGWQSGGNNSCEAKARSGTSGFERKLLAGKASANRLDVAGKQAQDGGNCSFIYELNEAFVCSFGIP